MNKREFVKKLKVHLNMNEDDTYEVLNGVLATFEEVFEQLPENEMLRFVGFGTFSKKMRQPRQGQNPQTGESIRIPAKTVITFKMGKDVDEKVNAVKPKKRKGTKGKK